MRWRAKLWVVVSLAVVGPLWAQEQPVAPLGAQGARGTRVVVVQEVPLGGQDLPVGDTEKVRVASTDEVLVRVETGSEVPAIVITPRTGRGYTMRVKFLADPEIGGKLVTAEEMKRQVESAAAEYTDGATDPAIRCKSLKYGGRPGWYATLSDRRLVDVAEPAPNDFKHVAVGVVRISEKAVMELELFTNDLASRDFFGPLEFALRFVKPLPGTQPAPAPSPSPTPAQ